MKRTIIALFAMLLIPVLAQNTEAQTLPSSGDRSFEVTASPFSATPVTFNEVKVRSFQSQSTALRLRTNLTYNSDRINEDDRDSRFTLALAPGYEWHALQSGRVSAYYGAELPIRYVTSRQHRDDVTNKNLDGGEHLGIGLNGLVGVDVHFLQILYTGFEVRYGMMFRSFLDGEMNDNVIDNDSSDFSFGSSALGRFRLGITF